jgi:hypothetical protein
MIEYFKKKLEALADSVLEPLWNWVMAASLKIRIAILLICCAIGGVIAFPDVPGELYKQSGGITRTMFAESEKIPLPEILTEKISSTAKRLSQTIKGDLLKLNVVSITPWAAAQAAAATVNMEAVILDKGAIVSFIRSNTVPGCACWTEIPQYPMDAQCVFISGWVMTALADMDVPATSEEIRYALDAQNKDGWWPTFYTANQSQYASTYSTAWNLIGLLQQKNKGFISQQDVQAVDNAITKATGWLLSQRTKGARWKPYPNLNSSNESESISGLVLHALHLSAPDQVAALDKEWIASLTDTSIKASDGENYYVVMESTNAPSIDHFVQIKIPWMLIATIDAFPSGDVFERTKALLWLERILSHESVINSDTTKENWWRAELLYALRYALKRI